MLLSGRLLNQLLRVFYFPRQCGPTTQEPQGTLGSGGKEGTRTQEVGLGPASDSYQRCHWALGVLPEGSGESDHTLEIVDALTIITREDL